MQVESYSIPGLLEIFPKKFGDSRGFFAETWQCQRYQNAGAPLSFVQDNVSKSGEGILRGLHHQTRQTQGKLIYVLAGEITDVVVDIRKGSPSFGKAQMFHLDDKKLNQVYVPRGLAHGFLVRSPEAIVSYKCTDYYDPSSEISIRWDDAQLGLDWEIDKPTLSQKDQHGIKLADVCPTDLFHFDSQSPY